MFKVIKVKYKGGVHVPEEPLELEEEKEFLVKIIDVEEESTGEVSKYSGPCRSPAVRRSY